MSPVSALLFDDGTTTGRTVLLRFVDGDLSIEDGADVRTVPADQLRVTSRLAGLRRIVWLPDDAQLHCDDGAFVDRLRPQSAFEALLDRLERHPAAVAGAVVTIVAAAAVLVFQALPLAAERIARAIPQAAETRLGEHVLAVLDEAWLARSALPRDERIRLNRLFREFVDTAPDGAAYSLHLRSAGGLANAFALPGGRIVLTDALVGKLEHDEALLAVLAHEIGHVRERHLLRSVLQNSAILLVVGMLAGDPSGASGMLLAAPVFLLNGHYSRAFEQEADAHAHQVLAQRNLSPAWFGYAIGRLAAQEGRGRSARPDGLQAYLASHPADADRMAAAFQAAQDFPPIERALAERLGAGRDAPRWPAADLVGCWSGWEPMEAEWSRFWTVEFDADGSLQLRFDHVDPNDRLAYSDLESGSWALGADMLVARSRMVIDEAVVEPAYDRLHAYRIEHLDQQLMLYVQSVTGVEYLSERIDCELAGVGIAERTHRDAAE